MAPLAGEGGGGHGSHLPLATSFALAKSLVNTGSYWHLPAFDMVTFDTQQNILLVGCADLVVYPVSGEYRLR